MLFFCMYVRGVHACVCMCICVFGECMCAGDPPACVAESSPQPEGQSRSKSPSAEEKRPVMAKHTQA
ncbi:hypothetical protein STEG23_018853 [Scotinomys teguina]